MKGVVILVLASAQLAAAFVPHLAPTAFGGRGVHARAATNSVRRNVKLPATIQLKAAETNTALSEFSGVDASGNQVTLHIILIQLRCTLTILRYCRLLRSMQRRTCTWIAARRSMSMEKLQFPMKNMSR
jgi:hypothetical protein